MEISFEEPYEDGPSPFIENKSSKILQSITNERFNRTNKSANKTISASSYNYDSPPSPISLEIENENKESIQIYKLPLSHYSTTSMNSLNKTEIPKGSTHNQLKKPDFNQISQIYRTHKMSPDKKKHEKKRYSQPRYYSRPSSAPLTRKNIVQELIKEREDNFRKNCTFKPKINENSDKKFKSIKDGQNELTLNQRILKLSRPKSEANEKREKLKRNLEEEKYSECTFKPSITYYKGLNKSFTEFPVQERLYQDAELKFYERERIKKEKEEEIIANFPFRPQVQATINKLVGEKKEKLPIYQRLEEIQKEMAENRNNIRLDAEINDPDLTFKPKINSNSYYLAHLRRSRGTSASFRSDSQPKRSCLLENTSFEEKNTPQVSSKDFLQRQKILEAKAKAKKEEMAYRMQKTSFNFKPEIDKVSKYIAQTNKARYSLKPEDRFKVDQEKSKQLRSSLDEKYYGVYKFEPTINEISKNIAKSTSLSDIANSSFSINMKRRLAEEKAIQDERSHSFTPTRVKNDKLEYVTSFYKQSSNLSEAIREREELKAKKIEEKRKAKEYNEMKECTFTPQATGTRFYQKEFYRNEVKGMDRFLELRAIAYRRDEELLEREKKVFFKSPKGISEGNATTPKPFNLHPSNKKQKIEKIREEIMKKEIVDCVFKPKINT